MTLRFASFVVLCLALIAVCGAQQTSNTTPSASTGAVPASVKNAPPPGDRVVMKVGNMQVTQAEFETMISDLEAQQGPADMGRRALGENFAQLFMLYQQALGNHLDTSPEVVRQLALDRKQILSNAEFARLKTQATPTPEEISAYYNAHLDDYDVVEIRRLFIWSSEEASKNGKGLTIAQANALADSVRHAYSEGGDVKKIIDATPHGPDDVILDTQSLTFQRGEMPPRMDQAAFAVKEGGWAELNDAPGTYVFLRILKRSRRDLKEVSPQIEKKLQAQKLKDELSDLKKNAGIWLDEDYFPPKTSGSSTQSKASAPTNAEHGEEKDEDKRQK